MRRQTAVVPLQTAEGDQLPDQRFRVCHELLVDHVERLDRQDRAPMVHQPLVGAVVAAQLPQVRAEVDLPKTLRKARHADVAGIAAAVDHPGPGKERGQESQVKIVQRSFVGDPRGRAAAACQLLSFR